MFCPELDVFHRGSSIRFRTPMTNSIEDWRTARFRDSDVGERNKRHTEGELSLLVAMHFRLWHV